MTEYFSASYVQGRHRFLAASQAAGGAVQSFVHPHIAGPGGEELAIDCARFGPADARRLLVAMCGLHGLEAAAGSATMLQWLALGGPQRLEPGVAVLLIHALNPYGWAYASRGNEDRIDLNRNSIDWSAPLPVNPAYEPIHRLLVSHDASPEGLDGFITGLHRHAGEAGLEQALVGATAGQYAHDDGISFGGRALAWSSQTVQALARAHLPADGKVLLLDWHTGIGPWAEPYFILDAPGGGALQQLVGSWWPDRQIHCEDVVEGFSIEYHGLLTAGIRRAAQAAGTAQVIGLTVEWGTYDVDSMLQALAMDNWLRNRCEGPSAEAEAIRARLIDRFLPADPAWRQAVIAQSEEIYAAALAGLANWA